MSLAEALATATVHTFNVVVISNGVLVMNDEYPHESARRDATIDTLLAYHDEVTRAEIQSFLRPYGGADADHTLNLIVDTFTLRGAQVDVYLTEVEREPESPSLFGAFTDYGDGDIACALYPSEEARFEGLRNRVVDFYTDADGNELSKDATEADMVKILETTYLLPTKGRIHLFEARRDGDAYRF